MVQDRMEKVDGRGSEKKLTGMGRLTIAVYVLWIVPIFFETVWAQKTDIVVLKNGDRITGEVKELRLVN